MSHIASILNSILEHDILAGTVDSYLMRKVKNSHMEFAGTKDIILYTALNRTNTELLVKGNYKNRLIAYEYSDAPLGTDQAEYIIKISYNTNGLYDMLHPRAYQEIEELINQRKLKRLEIQDTQVIDYLLHKYTGIRVHSINTNKKCYSHTNILFGNSKLAYILNPQAVRVLETKSIHR